MADEMLQGRIAVLETLLTKHELLPIHPLAAQMLRELQSQVSAIRVDDARREEREIFIKSEIVCLHAGQDEIQKILRNGLSSRVDGLAEDMKEIKEAMGATRKDLKSILFPIVTHVIEISGAAVVFLVAARAIGLMP